MVEWLYLDCANGSMPKLRSPLTWQTGRFNKVLEELWDNMEKGVENDYV